MSNIPINQHKLSEPRNLLSAESQTLLALELLAADEEMDIIREELLDGLVLRHVDCTRKPNMSYRKLIASHSSPKILKFIWKESSFVSTPELKMMGMSKMFDGSALTAYSLAMELTESIKHLSATYNRIRNVAMAGDVFRLVRRGRQLSRELPLRGTPLLHDYMCRLARSQIEVINRVGNRSDITDL